MWRRQKTGSIVCPSCGRLVAVNDERCFHCGRWHPGLWGFAPLLRRLGQDLGFGSLVIWGCTGLYIGCLLFDPAGMSTGGLLNLFSPSLKSLVVFGASGSVPVFQLGRWWTVLSAAWLHGGLLHILFNLMWVRQLIPATADIYGAGRMVIVYTCASVTGFLLSTLAGATTFLPWGAAFTIGASAPVFGLLGALVYSGRRGGSSMIGRQAQVYAAVLFIFGLIIPRIDNWAHLGGFIGGYLTAKRLDPLKPERVDHLIAALACVVLAALSVLVSVLDAIPLL